MGISPQLSDAGLEALAVALRDDDPRLVQGVTTEPLPLPHVAFWPVEATCVVGFCGWQGDGLKHVHEVEEWFGKVCIAADVAIDEMAGVRWFFNWADEVPRDVMRAALLPEVLAVLKVRKAVTA